MNKAPQALGMLCLTQDGGTEPPSQATQEAFLQATGSAILPSCECAGTAFPLFVPLIPSAQQLPKCNSGVLCLQPPVEHCLLGITWIPPNKGPQIWISPLTSAWQVRTLSRTVSMPASLKPFGFADLCLTPLRNALHQTQHILVDLGTVLSQQDTSAFCDLKPYFSEVQLCLFIEINLHSIWFVTSWPHHQGSNRQDPVVTSALDTLGSIFYRNSSAT